jgi:hypothetical protein
MRLLQFIRRHSWLLNLYCIVLAIATWSVPSRLSTLALLLSCVSGWCLSALHERRYNLMRAELVRTFGLYQALHAFMCNHFPDYPIPFKVKDPPEESPD